MTALESGLVAFESDDQKKILLLDAESACQTGEPITEPKHIELDSEDGIVKLVPFQRGLLAAFEKSIRLWKDLDEVKPQTTPFKYRVLDAVVVPHGPWVAVATSQGLCD